MALVVLGQIANITQLLGIDIFGLIKMIMKAAEKVSRNEETCRQISDRASMIKDSLEQLQSGSSSFVHPQLWKPIKGLKGTLRKAHRLVVACQHSSYVDRFFMGSDIANQLESVKNEMDAWSKHLDEMMRVIILNELTCYLAYHLHMNRNAIKQDGENVPDGGLYACHLNMDRGKLMSDDLGPFQLLSEPNKFTEGDLPSDIIEEFSIKNYISRCCCWCSSISYKGTGLIKFSFSQMEHATNYFSLENKIGFGGSSYVYKGRLKMGLEVAVKRASYEGKIPFKHLQNEIDIIPMLQHTNIVKLLGYCMGKRERILVFEYMPYGSLDSFIDGERRLEALEWPKRRQIIEGIAQGAKYLHQQCEPHIIHGDLKPGNILLDSDFNPKICDFGISKALKPGELEECTGIITGSRGFIAPEYIRRSCLSIKSDVYSFGVTLLQIISRKRLPPPPLALSPESRYYGPLNKWAWDLWVADGLKEFIDPSLNCEARNAEIMSCVQIALLCVQQNPEERPSMSDVLVMLCSEDGIPNKPNRPAYY